MKLRNLTILSILFIILCFPLAAQDTPEAISAEEPAAEEAEPAETNPLSMSLTVKGAYYPGSEHTKGSGTRWAWFNSPFSGLEAAVQFDANYTIPTPLGDNFLLRSANVMLTGSAELSPVTIKPIAKVTFTPLPFLVFNVRGEAGTGWNIPLLGGINGMAKYANNSYGYNGLFPFGNWFLKFAAQGIFQFDTAAVWPGDWHHIQLMYTYEVGYEYLTGTNKGDIWEWQNGKSKANGWQEYQSLVLAYSMPLVISRAGVMLEATRHYNKDDYGTHADNFKGDFMQIDISPMSQFTFTPRDVLTILLNFSSRRGYQDGLDSGEEIEKTYNGREWYFRRLAFQYVHTF